MSKHLLIVFLIVLLSKFSYSQSNKTNRIIIKFKTEVVYKVDYKNNLFITSSPALASVFNSIHVKKITSLYNGNNEQYARLKSVDLIKNIHFLDLESNTDVNTTIETLQKTGLFEYVEHDQPAKGSGVRSITPNDQYYSRQWGLKNNGTFSSSAVAGADVDMEDAWTITTGSNNTIVCILDTGLKLDHPEFGGRLWVNAGEIPNNGIDDDNNGYIDDVNGWDWVNTDNNPIDDYGHGTNVAGILAATGNNNIGYAGVNWNCEVMIGKVLDNQNTGYYSWMINGLYYAVVSGANVINMSIGGSSFSQGLKDACDFSAANNVMLCVSMGNNNNNVITYPAAFESTIAVGATDVNDYRVVPFFWSATSGSNFAPYISVVAPGNYIYGLSYSSNTNYNSYWGGTSQASPLVAGIASLMHAIKPDITFQDAKNILQSTAVDLVGNPAEDSPGWDQYMGWGRVNAYHALQATVNLLPVTMSNLIGSLSNNAVTLKWKTMQEINCKEFIIQHAINPVQWKQIGVVNAKGNSSAEINYSYNDLHPVTGSNYYRLRQVDKDNNEKISNIVKISNAGSSFTAKVISPFGNDLKMEVSSTIEGLVTATLYAENGTLVKRLSNNLAKGSNQYDIDTKDITKGQYVLILKTSGGENRTIKVVKL